MNAKSAILHDSSHNVPSSFSFPNIQVICTLSPQSDLAENE
jgi:hypothetical protein